MRTGLLLLLLAAACGGSSSSSNDCGSIGGQDCGPTMSITMNYAANSQPCTVAHSMPAEQFYFAVVPTYQAICTITEESATTAIVDCGARAPAGCNTRTCAWQPPVL